MAFNLILNILMLHQTPFEIICIFIGCLGMPWCIIFPYIQKTSIFFYAINKNLFYYSIDVKRSSYKKKMNKRWRKERKSHLLLEYHLFGAQKLLMQFFWY